VLGTVARFDEERGDGVILSESGESYYFHCVAIANGTRTIVRGTRVAITVGVGHLGADEAVWVDSLGR
jgi:cold shock CspA family protein